MLDLLPDYPALFWPAAAMAVVFIGVAKAGFGGGAGVIGTPLMALTISVGDAVALLLPLLIFCDFFSVWHYRTTFHRRSARLMLPGAALGIGIGMLFFGQFLGNQQVMRGGIGTLALLIVIYQIFRVRWLGRIEARRPHAAEGVLMGTISGFTSTLAHAGGPPVAIFLLPQHLPRREFVGSTVIIFAAINLMKVGPYVWLDLYHVGNLATVVVLAPLTFVGVRLGIWLNARFTDSWFNRAVYVILVVTGIRLVSQAMGW
ncbi:MAG: sulfite exporter TauE/SafE family protein [Candidatus Latescibacterota bacterium]|nr:sulfite exporter TauE/SafE family protein [Candidatus Latescibacterota bacterium]